MIRVAAEYERRLWGEIETKKQKLNERGEKVMDISFSASKRRSKPTERSSRLAFVSRCLLR